MISSVLMGLRAPAAWAEAIAAWSRQGREVFCYFDNDEAGYAAQNALQLQDLLVNGGDTPVDGGGE